MAKILAFAGSNSSTSINLKMVKYTVDHIVGHEIQVLDMVRFPFEMYSEDREKSHGFPNSLIELKNDIQEADGLIISVNEHNGNLSAYFKNLVDWLSRLERKFLLDTKVLLMATSGGGRGAMTALGLAEKMLPRFGAEVVATFSLPLFGENLDNRSTIADESLAQSHSDVLKTFLDTLNS